NGVRRSIKQTGSRKGDDLGFKPIPRERDALGNCFQASVIVNGKDEVSPVEDVDVVVDGREFVIHDRSVPQLKTNERKNVALRKKKPMVPIKQGSSFLREPAFLCGLSNTNNPHTAPHKARN